MIKETVVCGKQGSHEGWWESINYSQRLSFRVLCGCSERYRIFVVAHLYILITRTLAAVEFKEHMSMLYEGVSMCHIHTHCLIIRNWTKACKSIRNEGCRIRNLINMAGHVRVMWRKSRWLAPQGNRLRCPDDEGVSKLLSV